MRRRIALTALAVAALVWTLASRVDAALSGEVMVASDMSSGQQVEFSAADGSGLVVRTCGGDLTHGGAPRYFLTTSVAATGHLELFAYDESCTVISQLTNNTSIDISSAAWSPNGLRVAFSATRTDPLTGTQVAGLYVGDVVSGSSGPSGLTGVRLALNLLNGDVGFRGWSGDNRHVTYHVNLGDPATPRYDLFVADLDTGRATNLSNTPSVNEFQPSFSPLVQHVNGRTVDRLAFIKRTSKGGPYRNDIFTFDVTFDSTTGEVLQTGPVTQVTNKTNATEAQISYPAWSPDGGSLAFMAVTNALYSKYDVYRIRADGTQKAINLTGSYADSFGAPLWRK